MATGLSLNFQGQGDGTFGVGSLCPTRIRGSSTPLIWLALVMCLSGSPVADKLPFFLFEFRFVTLAYSLSQVGAGQRSCNVAHWRSVGLRLGVEWQMGYSVGVDSAVGAAGRRRDGGGGWDVRTVARRRQKGGLKRAVSALPDAAVCFVSAVAATTNDATTCAAAPTKRRAPRRVGRWCHQDGVPSLLRGRRIRRRPAAVAPPRRGTPPTPVAAGGRARRGASARRAGRVGEPGGEGAPLGYADTAAVCG